MTLTHRWENIIAILIEYKIDHYEIISEKIEIIVIIIVIYDIIVIAIDLFMNK